MMKTAESRLVEELERWDFTHRPGERLVFVEEYDLTEEDEVQRLDGDSADASTMVAMMELNYDINARHYSTVTFGDRIVDMVEVKWEFWK